MKTNAICIAVLIAAFGGSAYAAPLSSESDTALTGAALVDFESGPSGNWISQSFGSSLTVTALNTVAAPAASFSVDSDYSGSYNTRGRLHITNHGSEFQSLRFDFGGTASAFGFLFGASDSSWELTAYNSGGTALESMTIPAVYASNAGDYFGLKGLAGAAYAILTQNHDGIYSTGGVDYVFVDNFRVAAVPEPETYAMLLAGLGLMASVARRRKQK